ncbi:MAG: beta-methylgalactoside transporter [Clostridia bacterium]|nr:beta-methylgalactoside transporter [Candidatus Pelethousia sp.]NCB30595.1 beta-methylgalactoside transporter [Clostridia bacterium]
MQIDNSKLTGKRVSEFLLNNAVIIMMLVAAVAVSIMRPNFLSAYNAKNLISNTAARFIIALGVSGCLITKGTDLSAGRMVGLAACLSATFMQRGDYSSKVYPNIGELPIIWVFLGVVAVCMVFGVMNGLVVSKLHVPPFIATLGMQTIVYGVCLVYTGAQPIGGLRADYTRISSGDLFGIQFLPYLGIIALILGAIMWFVYNKTPHGKYMYAIGGNESSAEVAGINTTVTKIIIYTTAACLYGIAGFLYGAKSGGASVNLGMGYELEAIAGCTIGGVSTNGGVGRISGMLIGVLVFELLKIAMQFMGVPSDYTYIVQGMVIIMAVSLDIRKYVAKK